MKVIVAGDRNITDGKVVIDAIDQALELGWEITEVVSGAARGVDSLGETWAKLNDIPVKLFKADWNNLKQPGAVIKVNQWGKKYNANAGLQRNEQMAQYADALIAVQPNGPTPGTQNMIRMARKYKLKVHLYEKRDEDYEYIF
jgi:glycerophosphoryl diester phosphodiesterase